MVPLVSIILPSFKRGSLLNLGLYSLTKQRTSFDFEIIVLNDGLEDDTEEICTNYNKKFGNVRYIFTGKRNTLEKIKWRVPGFANNIGVKQSQGKLIALSSPEVWHLTENNLELLVSALKDKTIVAPRKLYFDDENVILPYLTRLYSDTLPLNIPLDLIMRGCPDTSKSATAYTMPFFLVMYKSDYINIGGYDEDFIGYAGDDNDFIGRIKLINKRLFVDGAPIIHLYHSGTNNGINHEGNPDWELNYNLWKLRKGILNRNVGREWGVL